MTTAALLEASGIRKSFGGVEVLHGVDVRVDAGSVLALLGENGAGKSTLVKVLAGDHTPDAGVIRMDGAELPALDPLQARSLGIRMIFQELTDAGSLSVAENVCLGQWPRRHGRVSWSGMRETARAALAQLDADFDVRRPVDSLRVGERQLVEIARALIGNARVLVLDEPTAALSDAEVQRLFAAVRRLRRQGVGMVYITHRLDEVTAIADRVQVLRDGLCPLDAAVGDVTRSQLVSAMIGRSAQEVRRPVPAVAAESAAASGAGPVLQLRALSSPRAFADVDLEVAPGEVVALYGKIGSGTAEVAETVFGLRPGFGGSMTLHGRPYAPSGPAAAVDSGVGFLPADRQRAGNFAVRPVAENLAAPSWKRMSKAGLITRRPEQQAYTHWRSALGIRSRDDARQSIGTLSGGNQQKVLLARWLERQAGLLVLVEPTRGVDVGAREDIYQAIRQRAGERGLGVLVVTSDYEEVVQLADRALVMVRGRIVAELLGDDVTTTMLTSAAGG